MSEGAKKLELLYPDESAQDSNVKYGSDIKGTIEKTHTAEIIIGLCAPIGTDIHFVADCVSTILTNQYGYRCIPISMSRFIKEYYKIDPDPRKRFEYHQELISKGNALRADYGASILAEFAISQIAVTRESLVKEGKYEESQRICYIIDSIKNNHELELFRLIYSDLFYFFGVFSSLDTRRKYLENTRMTIEQIYQLINRDSGEEIANGQKVTDTFVNADFFLRVENSNYQSLEPKIKRFLSLIFGDEIITPSKHEAAMYTASAAAGNSACLSRQVGAALTDKNGDIISIGWNDVPKYDGGLYSFNESDYMSQKDNRCCNLRGGICFNEEEKKSIAEGLVEELIKNDFINPDQKPGVKAMIEGSKIKQLIEFSRSIHAEMHSILSGSVNAGTRIIGGRLYCTTYPCHNCARHIIAAGIHEVYYIEPYRKSLAINLHGDAMTESEDVKDKVRILMFDGVSPRRYLELFQISNKGRKEAGRKKIFPLRESKPKNTISLQAIPILEKNVIEDLKSKKLI